MSLNPIHRFALRALIIILVGCVAQIASAQQAIGWNAPVNATMAAGGTASWNVAPLPAGSFLDFEATVPVFDLNEKESVEIVFSAPGQRDVVKRLHAGDSGMSVPVRLFEGGAAKITAKSDAARELPLRLAIRQIPLDEYDDYSFEAEPNNSWQEAQPMGIGRHVYGNNDDTDYLDNPDENPVKNYAAGLDNAVRDRRGLDWFRIEYKQDQPLLVIFELDILDRDVSSNLRMYTPNADGTDVELYLDGKDPMEIIHDREPERYSKSITRTIRKGVYYLQVNGNHPRYVVRSRAYPRPPYQYAEDAVAVGAHYIMNVGDAWVAQVPREGNIYNRVENMHETTLRCTACHPSIFSTEAVLTAKKAGYDIQAKSQFRYVLDRIYTGPAPIYGPTDVNWQRYIAIPMQSQGKHGGIVMDFEKYVSGRETPTFLRYAPFLRTAWDGSLDALDKLHEDEANGVVPADSNVGFAARDWRVLTEAYRRTGDKSYRDSADNIRQWLLSDMCDQKNLQDKIHRIWAFSLLEKDLPKAPMGDINPIADIKAAAIEEMMGFQNADGGWPDVTDPGRASAVYTTGQVVWTLVQAGESIATMPKLQDAVDYILSQQKDFGGWFQTTTHENFQTPMRETRYAVMALAATHPALAHMGEAEGGKPVKGLDLDSHPPKTHRLGSKAGSPFGWGNRMGRADEPPKSENLADLLDQLDSLWEVPVGREEEFTKAILPLLTHDFPLVRGTAAETLGRVGTAAAFEPLMKLLSDPVKDVWRSAAWAVRQYGNRGYGQDAIKAALGSGDPAVRRGAARVFAYQFYGMDERLDIARELMKLADDPNMWTRLEAIKSLRQWFYRTGENAFKRDVVDLFIRRMGVAEHAAMRTNLEQGMYILLDENQEGGVSLERNIARFPNPRDREATVAARRHVEQSVLLEPVLEAMETGNELQREALLASFDGSFFAGRFYARNPRGMIDVGNDREFGFYYDPPQPVLDRTFRAVLADETLSPERRAQGVNLASFFFVPRDTRDAELQRRIVDLMGDPQEPVRAAARRVVREELAFAGEKPDEALMARVMELLKSGEPEVQTALLAAVRRNDAMLHDARVVEHVASLLDDPEKMTQAMIVADTDLLTDEQAVTLIEEAWSLEEKEAARLELIDRLFARGAMTNSATPSKELVRVLRAMALDPVTSVRERLIERLEKADQLHTSSRMATVLYGGLSDASPGIRLRSLRLAQKQTDFWKQGETAEYLLPLLLDPDSKIRDLSLASIEKFGLLTAEPRYARRVKTLVADAALGERAGAALKSAGLDANAIEAEGAIQRFGIPDLEFFREKVNPYFYVEGADKHACVDCHQNHNILRIEPVPLGGEKLTDDLMIANLNSALKVVNLADPEQSLLLRKPRSPQGQGDVPADSPTGLVHVGGPRWETNADPAYQAVLTWIRDAADSGKRRLGASASVNSYSPDYPPAQALDGDPQTIWHTEFVGATPDYPHEIVIDLGGAVDTSAMQYVPRQDGANGRVKAWEVYTSRDGAKWDGPVAQGEWTDDAAVKTIPLRASGITHVKLRGLSSVNGLGMMSAAEVIVLRASGEGILLSPGAAQ